MGDSVGVKKWHFGERWFDTLGTPCENTSAVEIVFSVVFQKTMETRVVNFENKHFGEGLKQKSACKTIGFTRYCLQLSTKPNLCLQVQFGIFSDMSLNFSVCMFLMPESTRLCWFTNLFY